MNYEDIITEHKLTAEDPANKWIEEFASSAQLKDYSREDKVKFALEAYYDSKPKMTSLAERRTLRIALMMLEETNFNLVKYFIESLTVEPTQKSALDLRETFMRFKDDLHDGDITLGSEGTVVALAPFGAVRTGETYTGLWRKASWPNQLKLDLDRVLPRATIHPIIFFDTVTKKLDIPKQFKLL